MRRRRTGAVKRASTANSSTTVHHSSSPSFLYACHSSARLTCTCSPCTWGWRSQVVVLYIVQPALHYNDQVAPLRPRRSKNLLLLAAQPEEVQLILRGEEVGEARRVRRVDGRGSCWTSTCRKRAALHPDSHLWVKVPDHMPCLLRQLGHFCCILGGLSKAQGFRLPENDALQCERWDKEEAQDEACNPLLIRVQHALASPASPYYL